MKKVTRQPILRAVFAHFHPRYIRMENRRINKQILADRKAQLASLEEFLKEHPEEFSRTGLFSGPYAGR